MVGAGQTTNTTSIIWLRVDRYPHLPKACKRHRCVLNDDTTMTSSAKSTTAKRGVQQGREKRNVDLRVAVVQSASRLQKHGEAPVLEPLRVIYTGGYFRWSSNPHLPVPLSSPVRHSVRGERWGSGGRT